jgi:hypothetical protein
VAVAAAEGAGSGSASVLSSASTGFTLRVLTMIHLSKPIIASLVVGVLLGGCSTPSPNYQNQRAFSSPNLAVNALALAAKDGDVATLEEIFGPEGREVLSSGDAVADRMNREVFAVALDEGWSLEPLNDNTKELIVGHERWPFPIPIANDSHGWWFDTQAGKQEVLARRIGRNELAAIGVCRTYVVAQREYAAEGRDGKPSGIFAQKVRSDVGKHNGLYWAPTSDQDKPSPLGRFAAQASAEGYSPEHKSESTPYYGYFYRILTRQGPNAPGGAKDYLANSEMTGGFALIAYPATYGNSGIMTFLVGPDGVVYEQDLGQQTLEVANKLKEYNPDPAWRASN